MAEALRRAIKWQRQIDAGEVASRVAIARREDIIRARVTQIMAVLRLAHSIQSGILSMGKEAGASGLTERALRPVVGIENNAEQKAAFAALVAPKVANHS